MGCLVLGEVVDLGRVMWNGFGEARAMEEGIEDYNKEGVRKRETHHRAQYRHRNPEAGASQATVLALGVRYQVADGLWLVVRHVL